MATVYLKRSATQSCFEARSLAIERGICFCKMVNDSYDDDIITMPPMFDRLLHFFSGGGRTHPYVYADYAAATPLDPSVQAAMRPYVEGADHAGLFGNPASIHRVGRSAKEAVERARKNIAQQLQVQADEIIFTGGGTESNNLAIGGLVPAAHTKHPHIITTNIEHASVLEPIRILESRGATVTYLPVNERGRVSIPELERAITPDTVLVSIAYANGEVGTIEKIRDIGTMLATYKQKQPIYFHTDASQAAQYLHVLPNDLHVDLLTLDASKIYGPKGVGLLFVKRATPLAPLLRGGMQERGLRAGTENVPGIVGMAAALLRVAATRESEKKRVALLRDDLRARLIQGLPAITENGSGDVLPNFLNICILGSDAEFLSVLLDHDGVGVSSASACRSISGSGASYVIEEMTRTPGCGKSSLRISLGRGTTASDIEKIAEAIVRRASPKKTVAIR